MPPNNKKQRGRESQKKKEAQNAAQKKAAAALAVAEREKQTAVRRAQFEARLQGQFGIPAVDTMIRDMATEKDEGGVVCYHGSSAEQFVTGSEFLKIVKTYVSEQKQFAGAGVDLLQALLVVKFMKDGTDIMLEEVFTNFVFALGVSLYLTLTSEEKDYYHRLQQQTKNTPMENGYHHRPITWKTEITKTPSYELESILRLGLTLKYDVIPYMNDEKIDFEQLHKYTRDLETERGIINRLYRETKKECGCMATDKNRAKDMDKLDFCIRCSKFFPKARTKICDRCNAVVYCSQTCSATDWSRHKQFCQNMQERKKNADVDASESEYESDSDNDSDDDWIGDADEEKELVASINGLFISEANSNNNRKNDDNDDDGGSGNRNGGGDSVVGKTEN